MPKEPRKFVNPLLQPTTKTSTDTETETSTLPATKAETFTSTHTSTTLSIAHRKRGRQAFEQTHERITLWIDKGLKSRFDALSEDQGIAKSTLLDEAISDLLSKYETEINAIKLSEQRRDN